MIEMNAMHNGWSTEWTIPSRDFRWILYLFFQINLNKIKTTEFLCVSNSNATENFNQFIGTEVHFNSMLVININFEWIPDQTVAGNFLAFHCCCLVYNWTLDSLCTHSHTNACRYSMLIAALNVYYTNILAGKFIHIQNQTLFRISSSKSSTWTISHNHLFQLCHHLLKATNLCYVETYLETSQ